MKQWLAELNGENKMRHIDISGIRLNHIKIFLAVAEYGSFTMAAEKLHMTQPYISKIIAQLEAELDLYLVIRNNRTNQITPAGKSLYQDWKLMMQNFDNALITAHSIQAGMTDKLRIGIGQLTREDNLIVQNLQKTKEKMRGLDIIVEYNDMSSLIDNLLHGFTDLIVISGHMLPLVKKLELEWQVIIPTKLAVYVYKDDPLYEKTQLELTNLKGKNFIAFYYENDNSYMQLLLRIAEEGGFTPKISCYVANENSFLPNLKLGNGIVLADTFTALESPDVKQFVLDIPNNIIAVWKPKTRRDSIDIFLNMFENC